MTSAVQRTLKLLLNCNTLQLCWVVLCSLWSVGLTDDTLELFASVVHECVTLRLD